MRTKLRGKVTLLFMTFALLIAVPAVAAIADTIDNDIIGVSGNNSNPYKAGSATGGPSVSYFVNQQGSACEATDGISFTLKATHQGSNTDVSEKVLAKGPTDSVAKPLKDANPSNAFNLGLTGCGTTSSNFKTVAFTSTKDLAAGQIKIEVNTYTDPSGDTYNTSQWFLNATDGLGPTVIEFAPTGSSVPVNTDVTAKFSEAMNATTISNSTFTLAGPSGSVSGPVTYNGTTNTATLNPFGSTATNLDYNTEYTATVTTGATDVAGNALDQVPAAAGDQAHTWTFTTELPPNSAPNVGDITGENTAEEGQTKSYSVTATDPDSGDTLTYAWSITAGDSFAHIDGAANNNSVSLKFDDGPSSPNVTLQVVVDDDNNHAVTKTLSISVANVAPTATFNKPTSVNEGSNINLSLTGAADASSVDTAAGFTYAFDCGDGNGFVADPNDDGEFSCSTNDNGSRTVRGKITDKDDGSTTYPTSGTATVTVNNVAPTATFEHPSAAVNEGSSFDLKLTNPVDPGTNDTLSYAFDCGDGNGFVADSDGVASCSTNDNGTRTVRGKIMDDDGGETVYPLSGTVTVTINNVDPVVNNLNITDPKNGVSCLGGNTVKFGFSFTDAGSADTHKYTISWGDGNTDPVVDPATSPVSGREHTYNGLGPYTITVTVTDDDNGSGNNTVSKSFHYNIGTKLLDPVNDTSITTPSLFKVGSTVPLKVNITDCNGVGVAGLSPTIKMMLTSSSTPLAGQDEGVSTQPNDTNWVMRGDGNGQYIYNLATKSPSLPDSSATYKAQITDHGWTVTTNNYFGLKPK